MRIIAVTGIRSQYIKLYALQTMLEQFKALSGQLEMIYIDAGQHYDNELSGGFIRDLGIVFHERIRYETNDPIRIFSEMIFRLVSLYRKYEETAPVDYVMVFGDANTTMAASIAASKVGLRSVHVEAGLRLGNMRSPEEGNRIVADHLASALFVSNKADMENIRREGLLEKSRFTGDIIQDAVIELKNSGRLSGPIRYLPANGEAFREYRETDFVIASLHRKENIAADCVEPLFRALDQIRRPVIFIAHPSVLDRIGRLRFDREKITVARYVPYRDMLASIRACKYLITDSGAFQREAYYLSKRCLIRQEVAFWQHLVDIGAHENVGMAYDDFRRGIERIEQRVEDAYPTTDYFGGGDAVRKIFENLLG